MSETQRFTQEEIQALPRWARLAFAARCVRRARNLLHGSPDYTRIVDRAIGLAEEAAARGQAADQLADAAGAAYTLALNAVEAVDSSPEAGPAPDEDRLVVACTVAHAAAFAAEAATVAVARMASYLASQSVDFAIQAHRVACPDQLDDVVAAMRADLEQVQEAVEREGWGNLTPVPARFFAAL